MTLQVEVEPGIVPRVLIRGGQTGLPLEGGTADGARWVVARESPGHSIVDPLAPLNVPIFYRCGDEEAAPVIRETRVYGAFTSLDGGTVAPFIMPHSWDETVDTGLATIRTAGGGLWHVFAGEDAQEGTHPVEARVAGKHIAVMRGLLRQRQELVFLHAPCPVPDCPVPPALACVVKSVPGKATNRKDLGEMVFSLDLQPVALTAPVAARSWWHTLHENASWFGVDVIGEAFK